MPPNPRDEQAVRESDRLAPARPAREDRRYATLQSIDRVCRRRPSIVGCADGRGMQIKVPRQSKPGMSGRGLPGSSEMPTVLPRRSKCTIRARRTPSQGCPPDSQTATTVVSIDRTTMVAITVAGWHGRNCRPPQPPGPPRHHFGAGQSSDDQDEPESPMVAWPTRAVPTARGKDSQAAKGDIEGAEH